MSRRWMAALGLALAAAACGETGTAPADAGSTPGAWTWTPDEVNGAPRAALVLAELTPERAAFTLVTEAEPGLYGLALRLRYDASVLHLASFRPRAGETCALVAVTEVSPGLLVVALSARGPSDGTPAAQNTWGDLDFTFVGDGPGQLQFVAERSAAFGTDGRRRALAWAGGRLARTP